RAAHSRRRGAHRHACLLRRAGRRRHRLAGARGAGARGGPAAHRQAGRGRPPLLEYAAVHFAIFDVETRIDKALVKAVLHRHEEIGDEEAYERTRAQIVARSRTGQDFFPLAFHVPVSIVIGEVNDERVLTGVQVLGAGGYSVRGGFHLLAQLVGLPGKGAVDGAGVQALWESGRLADIHAYCRRDVIQTYFLFLRLELMRGRITPDQHATAQAATEAFRAELGLT